MLHYAAATVYILKSDVPDISRTVLVFCSVFSSVLERKLKEEGWNGGFEKKLEETAVFDLRMKIDHGPKLMPRFSSKNIIFFFKDDYFSAF